MKLKKLFTFLLVLLMTNLVSQDLKYKLPIIIDADTANEIDDLFAITRALGEDSFELLGITAAQFHTSPYATSNSAMESHEMNKKLIDLIPKYKVPLKKGSSQPLEKINKPKAYRAVANACGKNPYPIIIPCHRVIGSNGNIGGYSDKGGVEKKIFLLKSENVKI